MQSLLGQTVGSYRIVRELGSGGMGSVYEAIHQQLGRRAAIKILRPETSQREDLVQRLFNEARAVNLVAHPGVVDIFELGRLPDGSAYILMEYLHGETLAARMQRRSIEVADCVRLSRQAAAVLAAAHERGIVHRDIKPENLMIVPDPEVPGGERVKILDFGIAKYRGLAGALELRQSATWADTVLGTPVYMAPEQCRGGGVVDDRADVYALGVLLYEMLCGRPPFVASSSGMLMVLHLTQAPPDLRTMISGLSPVLYALVESMMAKDPDRRPSMRTVCEVLGRLELQPAAPAGPPPGAPAPLLSQDTPLPVSRTLVPEGPPRRSLRRIAAVGLGLGAAVGLLLALLERHPGRAVHAVSGSVPSTRVVTRPPPVGIVVPEQVPAVEPAPSGWAMPDPVRVRPRRARSAPRTL